MKTDEEGSLLDELFRSIGREDLAQMQRRLQKKRSELLEQSFNEQGELWEAEKQRLRDPNHSPQILYEALVDDEEKISGIAMVYARKNIWMRKEYFFAEYGCESEALNASERDVHFMNKLCGYLFGIKLE